MGIAAVWGPPRSGKTTVAIDLATALSERGKSVLLISPEAFSELSARLGIQIRQNKSLMAAYKNRETLKQIVHKVDDLLFVLAVPFDHDAFGDDLSEELAKSILTQAKNLFDVVLVDCPSHTDSVLAAWALSSSDHVLLLSGANSAAPLWNKAYRKAVEAMEHKTFHICAEVSESFDYHTLLSVLDVTPEAWLPYFPNADMVQNTKKTLYKTNGKSGKAYTKAVDALCDLLAGKEEEA